MLKQLVAGVLACITTLAMAAVDVNKADQAQLETVKGVGTKMSTKILDARKTGAFKDWNDLIDRVPGVGPGSAARLSSEGLTVNGASYEGAPAKAADKASDKAADKAPAKK